MRKVLQRRAMQIETRCCMCWGLDEGGLNLEAARCRLAEARSAREMVETVLKLKGKEQLTVIMLLWLWWGNIIDGGRKEGEGLRQS